MWTENIWSTTNIAFLKIHEVHRNRYAYVIWLLWKENTFTTPFPISISFLLNVIASDDDGIHSRHNHILCAYLTRIHIFHRGMPTANTNMQSIQKSIHDNHDHINDIVYSHHDSNSTNHKFCDFAFPQKRIAVYNLYIFSGQRSHFQNSAYQQREVISFHNDVKM